ncbi:hypothetical protein BYT27DRAFT_6665579 [Phlegmacium glaucopus]|nr:hypothetical protein BYT27DRAFT_6665579 [Phlegmacium glaucopus]
MSQSRNSKICFSIIGVVVVIIVLCVIVPDFWIAVVVIVVLLIVSPIALCIWRSTRTTTTLVQQPPSPYTRRSNSRVAEPPLLSIIPPTEPPPIHSPISEHEQPHFTLDLVERIQQVQVVMVEIHRLENEPGGAVNHRQRIQELQRRVVELSNTTPTTATDIVGQYQAGTNILPIPTNLPGLASVQTSEPPPAYIR